jgi:GNAT superfamily N-acetyltransferase
MTTPTKPYFLRPPLPGDLGWVVEQHGKIYAEEYGWDWTFEALVAGIVKEFVERFDPSGEACWIALNPQTGERLGSVFVVRSPEAPQTTAKLRMLILTPAARGMGLGGQLTDTAMQFARSKGYTDMVLWTNSCLTAARAIYEKRGFKMEASEAYKGFGKDDLVSETWRVAL